MKTVKQKAFTLIELLLVIAIMGLMGTAAVGGYRAMQRGMEERGVIQNVNQFLGTAFSRAQIDRSPILVYFWNETLQEESETKNLVVVGRAVAVRRSGRLSDQAGELLIDEFGDLRFQRFNIDEDGNEINVNLESSDQGLYLYQMTNPSDSSLKRSVVSQLTVPAPASLKLLSAPEEDGLAEIERFAFKVIDNGGVTWRRGDVYGTEFADIQLPHNFIFGSDFSSSDGAPTKEVKMIVYRPGTNSGSGSTGNTGMNETIQVSALRPNSSGDLSAESVDSCKATNN